MLKLHSQQSIVTNIRSKAFKPKFYLSEVFSLKDDKTFAKKGRLISITTEGFVFHLKKKDMCSSEDSYLDKLINQPVGFVLSEFEVELHGVIKNFHLVNKNIWEVGADYLDKTPYFYKQCVVALLY